MKKVLILTTVNSTINGFLIPHIQDLKKRGFYIECAANINSEIDERLIKENIVVNNLSFSRNPLSYHNIKAFIDLVNLQKKNNYDIIFTHTPVASMYARLLKLRFKNIKITYMAHGFHFYKGAPIINWLIYYPIEKICSYLTDILIAINTEDYDLAKRKMKAKKVYYIPGVGFDVNKFSNTKVDRIKKRKELGLNEESIMILSVGELNSNKNHEVIIRAISNINRDDIHYFVAGEGKLKEYLYKLSDELGIKNRVHLLGFRNDINELYKISDIFCFPSKREGLSVSLMESMASGLPIICSDIRGNNDLINNNINGFLCDKNSINEFKDSIEKIIINEDLNKKFVQNNQKDILKFDIENVMQKMNKIYIDWM